MILVGNKSDMADKRQVSREEALVNFTNIINY